MDKKVLRLLSVTVVSAAILAGCSAGGTSGGETTGGTTDAAATSAAPQTPSGPKNVTVVIPTEPANVEPCNSENGGTKLLRFNVIQPLTDLDEDTRDPLPLLATSWERTDPTTWVFQIREGVTFHDGADLNAESVVFGLNRALNNGTIACSDTAKVSAGVTLTPEATGPYEVTITTSKPDPILDRELSFVDLVSPNTPADAETDTPIGTGPYQWKAWNRGQSIEITRFDGYWGDAPQADSATLIWRAEGSQRANVVTTGEADIAFTISDLDAPDTDQTKAYTLDSMFLYRLPIKAEPFTDIRVREAFRYAIDREAIAESLLGRTGQVGDQLVAESNNGWDPDFTAPGYDLDKAKSLLAEAAADGVDIAAPVALDGMQGQFAGSDEVQQAVLQNLQDAGFNVTLTIVDPEEWKKQLFRETASPDAAIILSVKHDNPFGDASSSFTSYLYGSGCCGTANDPELDSLLDAAFVAEGADRVAAFQAAADHEYTKDVSIVGVASLNGLMMVSDRVDYTPTALTDRYHGVLLSAVTFK